MKRRRFLQGAVACAGMLGSNPAFSTEETLRNKAAAKGLLYGCAVKSRNLRADYRFRTAVSAEAGILVPEYELKMEVTQPELGRYDFSAADYLFASAHRDGQAIRGHTLVWYEANPAWLREKLRHGDKENRTFLSAYITEAVSRYAGKMHSWDVVNEAVEPDDGRADGMRAQNPWFEAFGEDYISLAFSAARSADPNALLFLNEFGIEAPVRWNERRRHAVLRLLERLKKANVPIDGFGIQGHLHPYRDGFDSEVFARFLDELKAFDLRLMVTELDVSDMGGSDSIEQRDADIASITKDFLTVALERGDALGVLTWGLSDRYTWLSNSPKYRWPDGQFPRALPLDGDMRRKPMWNAIAAAFDETHKRD